MTGRAPSYVPSRLNMGGYGVTVRCSTQLDLPQTTSLIDAFCAPDRPRDLADGGQVVRRADGIFAIATRNGSVTADGSLSVEPERWAARHFRRAVMNGAGVYRLGLWAFLGARQRYTFTAPTPGASVEPHAVTVRDFIWRHALVRGTRIEQGEWVTRVKSEPALWCTVEVGEATPKGFAPGRHDWRGAQYRRAVMSGAGVYEVGLWAMLAQRRPRAQAGAPLGVNGAAQLDGFTLAAHGRVRHSVRWRSPKRLQWRQYAKVYLTGEIGECCEGSYDLMCLCEKRAVSKYTHRRLALLRKREDIGEKLEFSAFVLSHTVFDDLGNPIRRKDHPLYVLPIVCEAFKREVRDIKNTIFIPGCMPRVDAAHFAAIVGDREALRAFMTIRSKSRRTLAPVLDRLNAQSERFRARLARRFKPQRAPRRAPRPLYSLAVPPAAPLAPPALA